MVPQNQAPTNIPAKVAVATRPAWAVVIPNSPIIDGRANPSRSTSAPSAAHVTPQTPSSRFWNRPKPIRSTASWTVTALVVATVFLLSAPGPSPPPAAGRPVELPVAHQPHGFLVGAQRLSCGEVVADQKS